MEIHPIQSFEQMSKGQKVATVAGVVAGAAAIGATVAAVIKGGKSDEFVKLTSGEDKVKLFTKLKTRLGSGYKAVGADIAKAAGSVKNFITSKLPKFGKKAEAAAQTAETAAEKVVAEAH